VPGAVREDVLAESAEAAWQGLPLRPGWGWARIAIETGDLARPAPQLEGVMLRASSTIRDRRLVVLRVEDVKSERVTVLVQGIDDITLHASPDQNKNDASFLP